MIASLVLCLHLLGVISAGDASTFLFICGAALIIAEAVLPSGIAAFNGVLALVVAYGLKTGADGILGVDIGWGLFFGIAFVEALVIVTSVVLIIRNRRQKSMTGTESLIGQCASVVEWLDKKGRVRIQGEIWKAESETALNLSPGEKVSVIGVNDLMLRIKAP